MLEATIYASQCKWLTSSNILHSEICIFFIKHSKYNNCTFSNYNLHMSNRVLLIF